MILQQLEWMEVNHYGVFHLLRQMQSMQKAVQLTRPTFCVKSKTSINVVSFKKCYSICDM